MRGFDSCYSCSMIKFYWKKLRINKLTSSLKRKNESVKKSTISVSRQSFNLKRKNYQPHFSKNISHALHQKYHFVIHGDKVNTSVLELFKSKDVKRSSNARYLYNFYNPLTPIVTLNHANHVSQKFTNKNYLFTLNNDAYRFNALIDYVLTHYVLHKRNIHSKKASIIIAQIIDAGHFSKRTVYLSTTQSVFLRYKEKLTTYLSHYMSFPSLLNLKNLITFNKTPLEWNFYPKTTTSDSVSHNVSSLKINNFRSLENLFSSAMKFIWLRSIVLKSRNRKQKRFTAKRTLSNLKSSLLPKYRSTFYVLKSSIKSSTRNKLNFLWQKKKNYWLSTQKTHLQFFRSFYRLPSSQKSLINRRQSLLPTQLTSLQTFVNFDYTYLQVQNTLSKGVPYFTNKHHFKDLIITPQVTLLFLTQPWLLAILPKDKLSITTLSSFSKSLSVSSSFNYSNLQPHKSLKHIISKKILSLFSTNKIREDIIPMYYNTLIRFMEHCSGKKIFLQLYPFLNQNVTYDYIVRYKSWITRMKSYERRLGHKFFFEEALHIMHLSFVLRDSLLFSSWLKAMILRISFWKTRTIFRFLRYLFLIYFMHIFPELKIKGLKIRLKGKISAAGNSRKRTILYRVGQTSHSKLDLRVSHSKQTINTFTGVMGFQVWLFY